MHFHRDVLAICDTFSRYLIRPRRDDVFTGTPPAGHPDVAEVAVVGAPDSDRGMVVEAFVVLREGVRADPAKISELQDFAKNSIAPYKYPRLIEFVDALPKTISGKTQRYRLRERSKALLS